MQMNAEELRTAVAGQWVVRPGPDRAGSPFAVRGVGTDTREDLSGRLFVALRGERFDAHAFLAEAQGRGAAAALVDRRGPCERPAGLPVLEVGDTRVALGDLARSWRRSLAARVVAITGSSGKTTTRRLVDAALGSVMRGSASPKSFNNDIGVPLTVLGAGREDGYLVVEVGMNRPGEIAPLALLAAPHVAVVTMAGRAHLGGMGSEEAIVAEKSSIVDGLPTSGIAVVNGDQPSLVAAVSGRAKPGVRVATFGTSQGCQWRVTARTPCADGQSIEVREPDGAGWRCRLGLGGAYNAMNALAAIACARLLGVPAERVAAALAGVGPSDMRMVRQDLGGIAVYNDAYNANPDAVCAALAAFPEVAADARRRVAVLGDMLELGERSAALHAEVGAAAARSGAAVLAFVGPESWHGAEAARAACPAGVQVLHVPALDEAGVAAIRALLQEGDAVLLKGSRGSRMERLAAGLAAGGAAVPAAVR